MRFCEAVTLFAEKFDEIKPPARNFVPESKLLCLGVAIAGAIVSGAFRTPWVLCAAWGVSAIMLSDLHLAIAMVMPLAGTFAITIKALQETRNFEIGQIRGDGALSLIAAFDRVLPHERTDGETHRLCSMEELLFYLAEFEATDPRDIVFAIASLAKDYVGFTPDYRQSISQVYKNAVQQAVATSGSLNILCRPWAQTLNPLPSWVSQRAALPFWNYDGIYIRRNADPLVSLPHRRTYQASGSMRAFARFNEDESSFILTCKGFQLPAIACGGHKVTEGCVPASWLGVLEKSNSERRHRRQRFWRTLVADRDAGGNLPPPWYGLAFDDAYKLCPDRELDTKKLLARGHEGEVSVSSKLKDFLKRVQAVTWNKQLVRLEDESLGLVPDRTQYGDKICILYGCDVPVVLRRRLNESWMFIGEAFVHGVMDGQAMDRIYDETTFQLI